MSIIQSCLFLFWRYKIFQVLSAFLILVSAVALFWSGSASLFRVLYIFPTTFAIYNCGRIVRILNEFHFSKSYFNFPFYESLLYSILLTIFSSLSLLHSLTSISIVLIFILNSIIMMFLSSTEKLINLVILLLAYVIILLKISLSI